MKKYTITKLTEYTADYEGERDYVSINTNHKGSMTRLSKNEGLNLLMILDFKLGKATRGNHYHKVKDEYFYVYKGKINAYFKDLETGKFEHLIIEEGSLLNIKPYLAHAFSAVEESLVLEFSKTPVDENDPDSYPELVKE